MKEIFFFCIFLIFSQFILFSDNDVYRYGLFISSSNGFNEASLTNAKNRVQEIAWLFKEYCKVDDYQILDDPTIENLKNAFTRTREIISQRNDLRKTQFFLFYYGHGLPNGLLLGNELFQKKELLSQLESIKAELKLVILDACFSEILGSKNYLDFNTQSQGTVFISSSRIFEPSMADNFSLALKAALMGDADGFSPSVWATDYFYYEIYSKQAPATREFLKQMYNFNDHYTYLRASPETEQKVQSIFTSLGYEKIPERINFQEFYKKVLYNIPNNNDQKLIKNVFNYSDECAFTPKSSDLELCQTHFILEQLGFKEDNYVTLSELFTYLQNQLGHIKYYSQTPSINLDYFNFEDPVRIAYSNNKALVRIISPGSISIAQKTGNNTINNILTLPACLGPDTSRTIYLNPGKYILLTNKNEIKYQAEKIIRTGKRNIVDESLWSEKIIYHDYSKHVATYFTLNPKTLLTMPFIKNSSLLPGILSILTLELNINTSKIIFGGGLNIGINYKQTATAPSFPYQFVEIPIFINLLYTNYFSYPYFFDLEVGSGLNIGTEEFLENKPKNGWELKGLFIGGFGIGMNLTHNLAIALKSIISLTLHDNNYFNSTIALGVECKIKMPEKIK